MDYQRVNIDRIVKIAHEVFRPEIARVNGKIVLSCTDGTFTYCRDDDVVRTEIERKFAALNTVLTDSAAKLALNTARLLMAGSDNGTNAVTTTTSHSFIVDKTGQYVSDISHLFTNMDIRIAQEIHGEVANHANATGLILRLPYEDEYVVIQLTTSQLEMTGITMRGLITGPRINAKIDQKIIEGALGLRRAHHDVCAVTVYKILKFLRSQN